MKPLAIAAFSLWLAGCSMFQSRLVWRARDVALSPDLVVRFYDRNQEVILTMNSQTVNKLLLAHFRITRSAGIQAELLITEGEHANAFARMVDMRQAIGINTAMIKLIGNDIDEYAWLLGHEAAHWAKGHIDSGHLRRSTIQALSSLVGVGLSIAGVPAAGLITGYGADLIETSFSRDAEREADALGLEYMVANGFDPEAALSLQEKMLAENKGFRIPFLSTHPSGAERIDNLKKLIEAKKTQQPAEPERLDDR